MASTQFTTGNEREQRERERECKKAIEVKKNENDNGGALSCFWGVVPRIPTRFEDEEDSFISISLAEP